MKNWNLGFVVGCLLSLTLISCAFGPLTVQETARTVGKNHHELSGGLGSPGYVAKWSYGITDDWDFGVQWESLSIGLRTKYAFINGKQNQFSLAGAAGVGQSVGGSHYYGDLITSYWAGDFEPYGAIRIVHVTTDPAQFKDKDTGQVHFTLGSYDYTYGQAFLGVRYWPSAHGFLSLEVSSLFGVSPGFSIGSNLFVAGALGYRFF